MAVCGEMAFPNQIWLYAARLYIACSLSQHRSYDEYAPTAAAMTENEWRIAVLDYM